MSQSVLVHPGSLQECLPGASWTLPGSQKTVVSSMQRFLEDSDSFVVSLKLFQGVLECFGSLQKRPKPSWSAPEVSRNVSEHLLAGSWHPSRCPKASQSVRPGLCQWPPRDPGRVWKGSTTDPNAQMSAHSSPVKRPRASQKSPRMSQSTLQRPGTLQNVPKRPRVSDLAFANGLQDIRDVSGKALQRTRMPECLHMARQSRASHSSMLPQVLVKITPITSIANGVILAILSLVILSATTIQTISRARGASAPSC